MTNIDLLQTEKQEKKSSKESMANIGIIVPLGILILVFLAYGGLFFYTSFLDKKETALQSQITEESNKIPKEDINRVASFQERMEKIDKEISTTNVYGNLFGQLESSIIQGANIASLVHTPTLLKLEILTDNFFNVAKQVLSFKKSDAFSSVRVAEIIRDQDGKIRLTLELAPKTAGK